MFLLHKDVKVLEFDLDKNIFQVLNEKLLPYELCGVFQMIPDAAGEEKRRSVADNNRYAFTKYLAGRMLNLDRRNAKKILNAFRFSQDQTDLTKAKIAIVCRAISMTDCYWIDNDGKLAWDDINPRKNHLSEIVAHIALTGSSLTVTGIPHTPELTGQGAYAKAWMREEDGFYLYKAPSRNGDEHKIEISVSRILDCFDIQHVEYNMVLFEGKEYCKCKNMATEDLSLVTAEEVYSNCSRHGINFLQKVLSIDADSIYKMCVIDYLISNPDRHLKNWGFYRDNETGELLRCHPLFDHNNAFDEGDMESGHGGESMIFGERTKRDAAEYALKKCSLTCVKEVTREMFLTEKMYDSFMQRACQLGLYEECMPTLGQKLHLKKYNKYRIKNGSI